MDAGAPASAPDEAAAKVSRFQRRADHEDKTKQLTPIGLEWHRDVIKLTPSDNAEATWLAPFAAAINNLFEQLNDNLRAAERKREKLQTLRARNYFEVASHFFNLFKAHNVDLLSAERWLRRCEKEMATYAESSEEKKKLQNDAEHLREKIEQVLASSEAAVLDEPLVSGSVNTLIGMLKGKQKHDDWKRKAWNVLLLREVAEICSALSDVSQSSFINDEMSAVLYTQQLGELFILLEDKAIGERYALASEKLTQSLIAPEQGPDNQFSMEEFVEQLIKTSRNVHEIYRILTDEKNLTLTTFERNYLGIRLVRYNMEQLSSEVESILKSSDWKTTKAIVANLGTITLLKHIPNPFKNVKACQVLLNNKEYLSKKEELICISKFKITCLEHQILCFPKRDLDFIEALRTVLDTCADIESLAHDLHLHAFYKERVNSCGKLVAWVLEHRRQRPYFFSDAAIRTLHDVAKDLKDHEPQWFIENELKAIVWKYIRPVEIQKVFLDGRLVIEIKTMKTKLSTLLPQIESMMENPRVEEVRFIVTDCLILDVNINKNMWKGINISIQTDRLQVVRDVVIDVSGSNAQSMAYAGRALDGKVTGENGKNGSDGFAGESGGNVSILATEIDHPERLSVVSRGGDGGRGQDGGHGMKGEDGFSHTRRSLEAELGQNNYVYWCHEELVQSVRALSEYMFPDTNHQKNYYHSKTKKGGEMFYALNWDRAYAFWPHVAGQNHSFFLHKGGLGTPGGLGGKPGRGGMGGFGGRVEISSTSGGHNIQPPSHGKNGDTGCPGHDAENGRSGYDVAFVPRESHRTTWYGEDNCSLLKVTYHKSKPYYENWIWTWCPYDKTFSYSFITERSKATNNRITRNKRESKEESNMQAQAQANKKKNISAEQMLSTRQNYTDSIGDSRVTRSNFEAALKKELAELRSLSAVVVQENVRVNVHRDEQDTEEQTVIADVNIGHAVDEIKPLNDVSAENFVAKMVSNPIKKMIWEKLKYFNPSTEQFDRLFASQYAVSNHDETMKILLDKYRTASLQAISKTEDKYLELLHGKQFNGAVGRYLKEQKGKIYENDSSQRDSVRENFEKLRKKHQTGNGNETLKKAIKYFVEDTKKNHSEVTMKYSKKYAVSVIAKEQAWKRFLEELEKNPITYDLWVRAYNGEAIREKLQEVIAQDEALLAELVAFSAIQEFDWTEAANDEKVLQEVALFLANSGSMNSSCFREILADAIKQHIHIYHQDEDEDEDVAKYTLAAEHGTTHSSKMYALHTTEGMIPLDINLAHLELERHQQHRNAVFAFALKHINTLHTKKDIDSFVRKFLTLEETDIQGLQALIYVEHQDTDEEYVLHENNFADDLASVVKHFPENARPLMTEKLELLDPRYSHNCVVANLARRLAAEPLQVSSEVVHRLANLALGAVADGGAELALCQYIVVVKSQLDWNVELQIAQLEKYFHMKMENKGDVRTHLANVSYEVFKLMSKKLENHKLSRREWRKEDPITLGLIQALIQKLSECEGTDVLSALRYIELEEWIFELEEIVWQKRLELLTPGEEVPLEEAVHYLATLARKIGMAETNVILDKIGENNQSELTRKAIVDLLAYLISDGCDLPLEELSNFISNLQFSDWENNGKKMLQFSEEDRQIGVLLNLIKNNVNNSQSFISLQAKIANVFTDVHAQTAPPIPGRDGPVFRLRPITTGHSSDIKTHEVVRFLTISDDKSRPNFYLADKPDRFRSGFAPRRHNSCLTEVVAPTKKRCAWEQGWSRLGRFTSDIGEAVLAWKPSFSLAEMRNLAAKVDHEDESTALQNYVAMIGIVNSVIKKHTGFNLRETQKLSALLLLANENKSLIQVSTGEGKTMIVLTVAIIKALSGKKVHIVTSSSVLAKRDATSKDNLNIYNAFGVQVSHNCSEDVEERKSAYSKGQVVYGDLSNFQRDFLLDSFYGKGIMGNHTRKEVMIIDEVDSMLLDKGNNMLYLSHEIGDLDKLDCVYAFIWQWINAHGQEDSTRFDIGLIKSQILLDLFNPLTREDLKQLDNKLSLADVETLWNRLRSNDLIDEKGILKNVDSLTVDSLKNVCRPPFTELTNRILFLLEELRDRVKSIEVPNFLKQFVALHLEVWIGNAIEALFMEVNQDYVIDVDRSGSSVDVFPIVTILDRDTGTDQANSQWDDALHQFLQIKHGCKLSAQSLKAVFISNVTYFKLYDKIYGMTGTLGTVKEKEMLQSVHNVDFVIMPTSKPKKFEEYPPVIYANRCDWIAGVVKETSDTLDTLGRSALIICDTIEEVNDLADAFRESQRDNVHVYTRDYEEFTVGGEGGKLEPGHVVISTNLAGRGTDISPSKSLLEAGGLHVILTYLPEKSRVEQQAFGRAARGGVPGSGRLVVVATAVGGTSALRVADLRAKRDTKSQAKTEEFYKSQILGEEGCMVHFNTLYNKIETDLTSNNYPTELKDILLQFCINKWALWLDKNESNVKLVAKSKLYASLNAELNPLSNQISKTYAPDRMDGLLGVLDQPSTLVKIGKFLLDKNAATALKCFEDAAKREPHFAENALYYKCAARVQLEHNHEVIREDLRLAASAIDRRKTSLQKTARTIAGIREKNNAGVTKKDAFQIQTQNFVLVYESIEKSIDEIRGGPMTAEVLAVGDMEVGETIEKELVEAGILLGSRVRKLSDIPKEVLRTLGSNYGITFESLSLFLEKYTDATDINKFERKMQESLFIPNKKTFWEILTRRGLIREERQLVAIVKYANTFETEYPNLKAVSLQEPKTENVFIFSDELPATDERKLQFLKADFVRVVSDEKYKEMRKNGEAVDLKCAVLVKEKLLATNFLGADSITLDKVKEARICHHDALLLLRELEAQKILENRGGEYFLVTNDFDSLELTVPLYEGTIRNFLEVSFAHDLAFDRIKDIVASDAETLIQIPLMSNPHRDLLIEMFGCDVIERNRVDYKKESIGDTVTTLFNGQILLPKLRKIWDEIDPSTKLPSQSVEGLYKELETHGWLLPGGKIARDNKRKALTKYKNLDPTLRRIFDIHIRMAVLAESLAGTLEHGRGQLAILSTPDASLRKLSDEAETQSVNIEELTVFALNGGEHLIILGEKKYTFWMIISACAVIMMGLIQVVAGVLMEIYSARAMSHFGKSLIEEGIGDFIYSISAFCSGAFSWKDYGIQKAVSVIISVATAGITAIANRVSQASRYGMKLLGPRGAKIVGKQLIKEVGPKRLVKAVGTRLAKEAGKQVAKHLGGLAVDKLADTVVKELCRIIVNIIEKAFDYLFDLSSALKSLPNVLFALGPEVGKKMVVDLAQSLIAPIGTTSEWEEKIEKIGLGVLKATSKKMEKYIKLLKILLDGYIAVNLNVSFWNKLESALNNRKYDKKKVYENEDIALFEKNVKEELRKILQEKTTTMLTKNVATPIFKFAADYATKVCGKLVTRGYGTWRDRRPRERPSGGHNANDAQPKGSVFSKVRKLMTKRKHSKLLARIVSEDHVPLDRSSVQAVASVVSADSQEDITVVIHGDGEAPPERIETNIDTSGKWPKREIHVALRDGRYEPLDMGERANPDSGCNDHLYEALSLSRVSQRNASQSREYIQKTILTKEYASRAIRRTWHKATTGDRLDRRSQRLSKTMLASLSSRIIPTLPTPREIAWESPVAPASTSAPREIVWESPVAPASTSAPKGIVWESPVAPGSTSAPRGIVWESPVAPASTSAPKGIVWESPVAPASTSAPKGIVWESPVAPASTSAPRGIVWESPVAPASTSAPRGIVWESPVAPASTSAPRGIVWESPVAPSSTSKDVI